MAGGSLIVLCNAVKLNLSW